MTLRLVALVVLALVLVSGPASASDIAAERCPYGAISAVGPVDAAGRGDATPQVRCVDP